jgi:hypothetical protein
MARQRLFLLLRRIAAYIPAGNILSGVGGVEGTSHGIYKESMHADEYRSELFASGQWK